MVVSGKISYKHHQIDFEVKMNNKDIREGEMSEETKHELIHAINRKFFVKYPLTSTIHQVHVRGI